MADLAEIVVRWRAHPEHAERIKLALAQDVAPPGHITRTLSPRAILDELSAVCSLTPCCGVRHSGPVPIFPTACDQCVHASHVGRACVAYERIPDRFWIGGELHLEVQPDQIGTSTLIVADADARSYVQGIMGITLDIPVLP